jgi:hypothetical protein
MHELLCALDRVAAHLGQDVAQVRKGPLQHRAEVRVLVAAGPPGLGQVRLSVRLGRWRHFNPGHVPKSPEPTRAWPRWIAPDDRTNSRLPRRCPA